MVAAVMEVLQIVLWVLLAHYVELVVTWCLYLAVMNLQAHLPEMGPVAKAHGYALLAVALVFDAYANIVTCTFVFADLPREWLLTKRLQRYGNDQASGWRGTLSREVAWQLLDVFDQRGKHV